jgi:gamma-glutamylcysteine synthetase
MFKSNDVTSSGDYIEFQLLDELPVEEIGLSAVQVYIISFFSRVTRINLV